MPFIGELDIRVIAPLCRELLADFAYLDIRGNTWVIPKGYETDGSSIPRFAWTFTGGPFSGLYLKPSVVHDFLRQYLIVSRKLADKIFLEGMKEMKVNWFKRWLMYRAVRSLSVLLDMKDMFIKK